MKRIAPSLLDRMIAQVSPGWAARRMVGRYNFRALSGGGYYKGGRGRRRALAGWNPRGGSADADSVPDLPDLRRDSRDLVRNTPIATAILERIGTNVVGPGLTLQPQIDRELLRLDDATADAWERQAEREFALYAGTTDCDASGVDTLAGLQALALVSTLEGGDCFCVKRRIEAPWRRYGIALQFFEAEQVSTPQGLREGLRAENGNRVVDGIEIDALGTPVAVHIQADHPGLLSGTARRQWARVPIRGATSGRRVVNHLYERRRIGQSRGVPLLAPVIEALRQLGDYQEAELYAAVIGAMITVVYKSKSGEPLPNPEPTADTGAKASDRDLKMAPGNLFELDYDDDVEVPSLGRPNANFDPFFVAIVRQIGAALELPFEVLIQHFTASYSASRAALEQGWMMFRKRRKWLERKFCAWVYEEFLYEAVATGRLAAPGFFADPLVRAAWAGATWIGPARISIDPLKENNADAVAEDRFWKTTAQITAEKTGGDFERNVAARRKEIRLVREAGGGAAASNTAQPPSDAPPEPNPDLPEQT